MPEEQRKQYLPDLCSGKKIGAIGITEAQATTMSATVRDALRQAATAGTLSPSRMSGKYH